MASRNEEGARGLAAEIENNSTLRALDLSKNKIGVSGTKAIAEVLRKNSSLRYLNLNSNNSDVDGARSLKEALAPTTQQKKLLNLPLY